MFAQMINRVWWIVACVISIYLCGIYIRDVWNKWEQNPVIISFAEKLTPASAIPFPAVTICPETKFEMRKFNYTEAFLALRNDVNMSDTM